MIVYACPRCKVPLVEFACKVCGASYPVVDDVPCFITPSGGSSHNIGQIYDEIYAHHQDVWVDQGRSERFLSWFSDLAAALSTGPLLEIGCGEGTLLSAFRSRARAGIDPSIRALLRARQRSAAQCAVARAEELPFPSESFDIVASVGVMEHFEDQDAANTEIRRVLTRSGRYLALIHIDMTRAERLRLKVREFLFPRPRPMALARWVRKKLFHRIVQPLRKSYTIESACSILERNGLAVQRIITCDREPDAPLAGRHVVVFVAERTAI